MPTGVIKIEEYRFLTDMVLLLVLISTCSLVAVFMFSSALSVSEVVNTLIMIPFFSLVTTLKSVTFNSGSNN